jgi:hypothetical protein
MNYARFPTDGNETARLIRMGLDEEFVRQLTPLQSRQFQKSFESDDMPEFSN